MPHFKLLWRVILQTDKSQTAQKLLKQIAKKMSSSIDVINCQPYWKEDTQYEANFTCDLNTAEVSAAVFETLQLCKTIAHQWYINPPHESDGIWEFDGVADKPSIVGVAWISFSLRYEYEF